MELSCAVQRYAWGVRGNGSSVAQLAKAVNTDLIIADDEPFAELWMGTHTNAPSIIKGTGVSLLDYIKQHPSVLGNGVINKFGEQLPFLFKVLSVNQALSIQAHPNKKHAEELHSSRPDVYKDPNHKPEMTIALTNFKALCGFRPHNQITNYFNKLPELKSVVGEEAADNFADNPSEARLKECFKNMMEAGKDCISSALTKLLERFSTMEQKECDGLLGELFKTLHDKYPGDVGCFSIYLLNYITLNPGEAMFLGPNIIHAYLKGDCIECMACSDNVVRAGLTPKYQDVDTLVTMLQYTMSEADSRKFEGTKLDNYTVLFNPPVPDFAVHMIEDVDTLVTMLEYTMSEPDSRKFEGTKLDNYTVLFNPPVPDFAVHMIEIPSGAEQHTLKPVDSASILLVIEGNAGVGDVTPCAPGNAPDPPSTLQRGSVLFIGAGQALSVKPGGDARFLAFRALCVL